MILDRTQQSLYDELLDSIENSSSKRRAITEWQEKYLKSHGEEYGDWIMNTAMVARDTSSLPPTNAIGTLIVNDNSQKTTGSNSPITSQKVSGKGNVAAAGQSQAIGESYQPSQIALERIAEAREFVSELERQDVGESSHRELMVRAIEAIESHDGSQKSETTVLNRIGELTKVGAGLTTIAKGAVALIRTAAIAYGIDLPS